MMQRAQMEESQTQQDSAKRDLRKNFAAAVALIATALAVAAWLASMVKGA